MDDDRMKGEALRPMRIRLPTEGEVVLLNDWAYYRDLDSQGCTALQLDTAWSSGWSELVVSLLGPGCR